jgi:hypothetical protein
MQTPANRAASLLILACGLAAANAALASPAACNAMSGITVPTVVELYTSEGCNSCPPADRWLSSLKGQPGIVSLAFHVDYWDRLGWKDRFADPAYTQRQNEASARGGAKFVYTPQVLVDGADYRAWPGLPRGASRSATVQLTLTRDGSAYVARLVRGPGAPMRLAAFWVVTEDGHVSQVKAGENNGVTLHHDAVVRDYRAVPSVGDAPLRFEPRQLGETSVNRRVQLIVTDAGTGKPVQTVGC